MNRIITSIIFIFISLIVNCQTWQYTSGGNAFDGKYWAAYINGKGGTFPYNNPIFYINFFEKSNILNLYFTDVGYAGCEGKEILIKFNNDPIIYNFNVNTNSEKDSWFIEEGFSFQETLTTDQLLAKLKQHSSIDVRIISDCNEEDYKFSLLGSTKAISYVTKFYKPESTLKIKADKTEELVLIDNHKVKKLVVDKEKTQLLEKVSKAQNIEPDKLFYSQATYDCGVYVDPILPPNPYMHVKNGDILLLSDYDKNFYMLHFTEKIPFNEKLVRYILKECLDY